LFKWAKQYISDNSDNSDNSQKSEKRVIVKLFNECWNHYFSGMSKKTIGDIQAIFDNPIEFINANSTRPAPSAPL
jgi:hypothetical protein